MQTELSTVKEALAEYGLSAKEILVYLTLLRRGAATANTVAEDADLVRTTTYDILKGLRERGLVSAVTKNNILFYSAADPERLLQELEEKKERIKEVLVQLKQMYVAIPGQPTLELFEGKEGIKTVYQDILKVKAPLQAISNTSMLSDTIPFFMPHFVKLRVTAKIKIQLLTENSVAARRLMRQKDSEELRETRFLPKFENIPMTQYIYGDNVAIIGTDQQRPVAILVRHKEFAQTQRLLFETLWEHAR